MRAAVTSAWLVTFVAWLLAAPALAGGFTTEVDPESLDLELAVGQMAIEQVSISILPLCIRPIEVDVVASDPGAEVSNLTGVDLNSCGGDTSAFDVKITGTGEPQNFDLEFVDAKFGGVLDSIPVTIDEVADPAPLALLTLAVCLAATRRRWLRA